MNKEKRLEELINAREWHELSAEEKQFILKELGPEAIFHSLKKVNTALASGQHSKVEPRDETLVMLKQKIRSKHREAFSLLRFLSMKTPAYATMLLVMIALFVGWISGKNNPVEPIAVQTLYETDTVRVTAPADTIFVTKVIYRDRPPLQQPIMSVVQNSPMQKEVVPMGVSMKEKEELDNLLVSGSE